MIPRLNDFLAPHGVADLFGNMLQHMLGFNVQQVGKILIAYVVAEISVHYANRDPKTIFHEVAEEARSIFETNKLIEDGSIEEASLLVATSVVALVEVRQEALQATASGSEARTEAASVPADVV